MLKYLNRIGDVMEKIDSVTNDVGKQRPIAIFIISFDFMTMKSRSPTNPGRNGIF